GGTIVLPGIELERDPLQIADLISEKEITHLLTLPSFYSLILNELNREKMKSLSCVIVAGEDCQKDLVNRHSSYKAKTELFNEYGPTEGSVSSSVAESSSLEADG